MEIVNGVQVESASEVSSAVRFDRVQVKTDAEKAQARANCGAAAAADVTSLSSSKANATTVTKVAGMIAPAYDKTSTYAEGDLVVKDSELYVCASAIATAENWTAAHWTKTTLAAVIAGLGGES